jgi:hypothetical protein
MLVLYSHASLANSRIAVLESLPPITDSGLSKQITSTLQNAHYDVTMIDGEKLSDEKVLTPDNYDLLIIPHSDTFPVNAIPALQKYLQMKGKLLCVGGIPFDHLVTDMNGVWMSIDNIAYHLSSLGSLDIMKFPVQDWSHASGDVNSTSTVNKADSPHGSCLVFHFTNFSQWDNFSIPAYPSSPFPSGANAMIFFAKGDAHTPGMTLEWDEKDGSRWIAAVPLTTRWEKHLVLSTDFKFWRDGSTANRGGDGDQFHPENAVRLTIGIDQSHTPMASGEKEFQLTDPQFASAPLALLGAQPPVLESLSPWYKRESQSPENWLPILRYRGGSSHQPYGRLVGPSTSGWIYRSYSSPYAGAVWGACHDLSSVTKCVNTLFDPVCLGWAGPDEFSFLPGEAIRFTLHPINSGSDSVRIICQVSVFQNARDRRSPVIGHVITLLSGNTSKDIKILVPKLAPGDWHYEASIKDAGTQKVLDTIQNQFTVNVASAASIHPVAVRSGEFILDGKPWRPAGVNYWPLWSSGQDPDQYVAHWLSPNQYDPGLVERDMERLKAIGVNEASIMYLQKDQARSLIDTLYRCKEHGIHANVFIDGGYPLKPNPQKIISLIRAADLAHNPAVFAYDVAWEPRVGDHAARKYLDGEWGEWIKDQYGTIQNAQKQWNYSAPIEDGSITNPTDNQLTHDGPWRVMVCAYRRFIDNAISQGYLRVRQTIKSVDPCHLIGVRSGYGGNGSIWAESQFPFDLVSGAKNLDFISPEGYALNGDWNHFLAGGGLTVAYARWAGNGKPVYWAEFGKSVYPGETSSNILAQANYYRLFYRMALESRANGAACWWFPGGLRINENSDYGIFTPDGTPRSSALELHKYSRKLHEMTPAAISSLVQIKFDRDKSSMGFPGIWMSDQAKYLQLRLSGKFPTLVTDGTGKTTTDVPLVSVGDIPADGTSPLEYVDSEFNFVKSYHRGRRIYWNVSVGNTGEATWMASGKGRVVLMLKSGDKTLMEIPLPKNIHRYEDVTFPEFKTPNLNESTIVMRLEILGRLQTSLPFGECMHVK